MYPEDVAATIYSALHDWSKEIPTRPPAGFEYIEFQSNQFPRRRRNRRPV
jgi:hypothetical protein